MNASFRQCRTRVPELMDQAGLDEQTHREALAGLARINWLSATAAQFYRALVALAHEQPQQPLRILDVACGGGDVTIQLARMAARRGAAFEIDGCDLSSYAVRYASNSARDYGVQVGFFQCNALEKLPEGYDVLINSLFLHHLSDEETIGFLQSMARVARKALLVSDLVRSRAGRLLATTVPKIITRSRVVHEDAVRSIDAAYSLTEIHRLIERAGLTNAHIHRAWPSRFFLTWRSP